MYEQVVMYITAIAPSLATVVTAIAMFVKIISRTREMSDSLRGETEKKIDEMMAAHYAQMQTLNYEVKRVCDSSELQQMKEQYAQLQRELQEVVRMNAELLAKLNDRGY